MPTVFYRKLQYFVFEFLEKNISNIEVQVRYYSAIIHETVQFLLPKQ